MKSNKVLLGIAVAALLLIGLALQNDDQSGTAADNVTTEAGADSASGGPIEDDQGDAYSGDAASSGAESDDPGSGEASDVVAPERFSDLPLITEDQLPIEAIDTLILIDDGGPYPFDRDDLIFQNREGILPDMPQGHYREYTVVTPGLSHRGARRVVAGDDGERYYTQDHYESFLEIAWN